MYVELCVLCDLMPVGRGCETCRDAYDTDVRESLKPSHKRLERGKEIGCKLRFPSRALKWPEKWVVFFRISSRIQPNIRSGHILINQPLTRSRE